MKICIVYQAEFPPAERIEKEVKALISSGHAVFVLANNYGNGRSDSQSNGDEVWNQITIVRLSAPSKSRLINRVLNFPIFFNPRWLWSLIKLCRRERFDVIQPIDIPFALGAVLIGKLFSIPVVLDMWENYPEALKGWGSHNWKTLIFKNYHIARVVEKVTCCAVDKIITVVEEQRDRLIADGISADKIAVVGNTVDADMFLSFDSSKKTLLSDYSHYFKLLYLGGVTIERGLDDIIRALSTVVESESAIKLFIVGPGEYVDILKKLVVDRQLTASVHFIDKVPFSDIPAYISQSDLCLIPHTNNAFINTTMPNKLFQYMAMGKAILTSNAKPLARVIKEVECGYVFESGNADDAAEKILLAFQEKDRLIEMGRRGSEAVEREYNWDKTSREYVGVIQSMGSKH